MRKSHWGHSNLTVVQSGEFPSAVVTHRSTVVLAHSLIVRAARVMSCCHNDMPRS